MADSTMGKEREKESTDQGVKVSQEKPSGPTADAEKATRKANKAVQDAREQEAAAHREAGLKAQEDVDKAYDEEGTRSRMGLAPEDDE